MDIKLGDIITAYHKGYWRVEKIESRFFDPSSRQYYYSLTSRSINDKPAHLIYYSLVLNSSFKEVKKRKANCCDILFCKKISKSSLEQIKKDYCDNIDKLITLL